MGCAPGTQRRFLEYMDHYCRAVLEQVTNRSKNHIMDVESFTRMRRDTGALKVRVSGRGDVPRADLGPI